VSRWSVVLAGGVGSRFWPLSTPERPKQLLPLVTEKPLLVDTVDRLRPIVDAAHTLVLTNASLTRKIRALIKDVPRKNIIAEPEPMGTAAALTWAALVIQERDGPDATMLCVHADWAIGDDKRFRETLLTAEKVAIKNRSLVTVGIVPTRPDPGFGYIQPEESVSGKASRVKRFVEKPDRARAEEMRNDGYLWNSGIFVWRVGDFLDEVKEHSPELAVALRKGAQSRSGSQSTWEFSREAKKSWSFPVNSAGTTSEPGRRWLASEKRTNPAMSRQETPIFWTAPTMSCTLIPDRWSCTESAISSW